MCPQERDSAPTSSPTAWQPRRIGRYEAFCPLARGGMATVHLGRWLRAGDLSRLVALKSIHPHLAVEEQHRKAFVDEARLSVRIRHPNVITTLDLVEEHDGGLVMVMDFVPALTLAALWKRARGTGQRIALPICRRLGVDVLRGLQAAHETHDAEGRPLHIVHRDVSPDNVLVGDDGRPRVIDFGIARAERRSTFTATGIIKGKLRYLAPEQLLEGEVDPRTDVYAASVVLWQLVTGERLFGDKDDGSVVLQAVRGELPSPRDVAPEVPSAIADVIMGGLAAQADARWPSAEAMADALERSGPVASHREVARWVEGLAGDTIERMRSLARSVETAAPLSVRPGPSTPRPSLTAYEPELVQERSRTQLTSHADPPPRADLSPWSTVGLVAATLAVGVVTTVSVLRPPAPLSQGVQVSATAEGVGAPEATALEAPATSELVPPRSAHVSPVPPSPAAPSASAAPEASAAATAPGREAPRGGLTPPPRAQTQPRPAPPPRSRSRLPTGI